MLAGYLNTREKQKKSPLHFSCTSCRCCLLLVIHQLPFLTPFILELVKKKMKQTDVSPVSSVIYKTRSTPHSSLTLYEKLKLNQGGMIKLSDFCWVRMNSYVCHICWLVMCLGCSGLRTHIHKPLAEMDLLTEDHLSFQSGPLHCVQSIKTIVTGLWYPPVLNVQEDQAKGRSTAGEDTSHYADGVDSERAGGNHSVSFGKSSILGLVFGDALELLNCIFSQEA